MMNTRGGNEHYSHALTWYQSALASFSVGWYEFFYDLCTV